MFAERLWESELLWSYSYHCSLLFRHYKNRKAIKLLRAETVSCVCAVGGIVVLLSQIIMMYCSNHANISTWIRREFQQQFYISPPPRTPSKAGILKWNFLLLPPSHCRPRPHPLHPLQVHEGQDSLQSRERCKHEMVSIGEEVCCSRNLFPWTHRSTFMI